MGGHDPPLGFLQTCFVTIVSANYLAYASVLAASVARYAPGVAFRVLVVDRPELPVTQAVERSGLEVTYAQELPLSGFDRLAYQFELVELNTALKPTFLKFILDAGFEAVVYLDPDIEVFAAPQPVLDALQSAQIVLTPHALSPVMDGRRPSDIDFLRNGAFNLGFVALRNDEQARRMLDWWERRCLGYGFIDTAFGVFVDQKWLDLAPAYFPALAILRHRGCNVAYWNLHERTLTRGPRGYLANGEPLVFFHFSGVKPDAPGELSRHQTRHVVEPGTPLAQLVADYCDRLLAAGHVGYHRLPYTYGRLSDGTPISQTMRRALGTREHGGGDPFDPNSQLQRRLKAHGIVRGAARYDTGVHNTLDLDESDRRLRYLHAALRLLSRVIGPQRTLALLRYASFLTQQSNFASVLLEQRFDVQHRDR
jgi:hypothetical protein